MKTWPGYALILCLFCHCTGVQQQHVITANQGRVADLVHNPQGANESLDSSALARITFAEWAFDFGTVEEGKIVRHRFSFRNTGSKPLVISKATSSCGCTVPEWPRAPVVPWESGEIYVEFDTRKKTGQQRKAITIFANTLPQRTVLYLEGQVIEKTDKP